MLFTVKTESLAKYFGEFGGQFVPETLMPALEEFEAIFLKYRNDPEFKTELETYLTDYVGRPSPLYYAERLTEHYGGAKIYLKREDLNHTGAHKINNAIAQALLAKRIGKKEIIAETGAGQHGVATATACALLGLNCKVFMGEEDTKRQAPNLKRMKLLGAEVIPVRSGTKTLKDATSEAIRYWVSNVADTHYIIGSAVGPHPYPTIVREFQKIIGEETKKQILEKENRLPDYVLACVGGGSNAIGIFYPFLDEAVNLFEKASDARLASSEQAELTSASMMTAKNERNAADEALRKGVRLIAIEASGHGLESGKQAASISKGKPGVLHGSMSYLLQDDYGQIQEAHSISAGLDYPGIGPEHSFLHESGLVNYQSCTDEDAVKAFKLLCKLEGIIPALESSHALAHLEKLCPETNKDEIIVLNLSGRGDKDLNQVEA